jgi:hypothetical protein
MQELFIYQQLLAYFMTITSILCALYDISIYKKAVQFPMTVSFPAKQRVV